MEKCSLKKHEEIDAISYCEDCNKNMCQKCHYHHSELFENHYLRLLNKFTGICQEENHSDNLDYFCKDHNKLCCAACISKIQSKGNGLHKDCNICKIEEIKEEKSKILKDNIKNMENLSNQFGELMEELKKNYEKVTKEITKTKIENIFIKIKESIDGREKELLSKVEDLMDNHFDEIFEKEKQKYESLSNAIEESLKKSRDLEEEMNDTNKINSAINECLIIEDKIKDLNNNVSKIKNEIDISKVTSGLKFSAEEDESLNKYLESLRNLGNIYTNANIFKFKKCPENISENKLYSVSGEKENIITKTGADGWVGIACQSALDKSNNKYIWTIKIIKSNNNTIMVGVAPINFDINSSSYTNDGWYLYLRSSFLYSGMPHNYNNKKTKLSKAKEEIKIVMNMNNRTLRFIVDDEDKGDSYTNIPINKPLVPVVFLYNKDDSVEINEN